jgi:chromosome segregation ATPase
MIVEVKTNGVSTYYINGVEVSRKQYLEAMARL